jgi:hypothetical protein
MGRCAHGCEVTTPHQSNCTQLQGVPLHELANIPSSSLDSQRVGRQSPDALTVQSWTKGAEGRPGGHHVQAQ